MLADAARWSAVPYSYADADLIAREVGLSSTLAAILVRRGYDSPAKVRSFLEGADRHDPFELGDMGAACNTIYRHVSRGTPIVVHGDYDVDGVASTAVLVRALRRLGARVTWHLPSRLDDGYGLSLAGCALFAVGGVADLVWHTFFGIERQLAAVLSPSHLWLIVAGGLIITGTVRAARAGADRQAATSG